MSTFRPNIALMKNSIFTLSMMLVSMVLTGNAVVAQQQKKSEEITVVAPYEPTIGDAQKITINPNLEPPKIEKLQPIYNVRPVKPDLRVSSSTLPLQMVHREDYSKLFGNYLKAGFGNYLTPLAEIYLTNNRSKKYMFGLQANHLSSNHRIKHYPYSGFSDNQASIFGKTFLEKKFALGGDLGFNRHVVHFYGLAPTIPGRDTLADLPKKQIRQRVTQFYLNAGFEKINEKSGKPWYDLRVGYYYLFDYDDANEHLTTLLSGLDFPIHLFGQEEMEHIGARIEADYHHFSFNTRNLNNAGAFVIKPYLSATFFDLLNIKAGFNSFFEFDAVTKFYLFPSLDMSVKAYDQIIILKGSFSGEIKNHYFSDLFQVNPFIVSDIPMVRESQKVKGMFSVCGTIAGKFSYDLGVSYLYADNYPFFVTDTTSFLKNRFTLAFDDQVQALDGHAVFSLFDQSGLDLSLEINYHHYVTDELKPWYKPALDGKLSGRYTLFNKLNLKAIVIGYTDMYDRIFVKEPGSGQIRKDYQTLRGVVGINLGAEYRINKALGIFVELNNLINSRYYRWAAYPSQKLNFLAGINFSIIPDLKGNREAIRLDQAY